MAKKKSKVKITEFTSSSRFADNTTAFLRIRNKEGKVTNQETRKKLKELGNN